MKKDFDAKVVQLETKSESRQANVEKEDKTEEEKETELQEAMALFVFKNQGHDRVSPQAAPQQKKPQAECDKCSIAFSTKDNLKKHVEFYHPPVANRIPVYTSDRDRPSYRPGGVVPRQYNCRECDFELRETNQKPFTNTARRLGTLTLIV